MDKRRHQELECRLAWCLVPFQAKTSDSMSERMDVAALFW